MAAILDILGAMIIGGVLMLVTNRGIEYGLREFVNHNNDAIVQSDLSTMTQILQDDLRKMGCGISEGRQATIIQTAESNHLVFLSTPRIGVAAVDTVEYSTSSSDTAMVIGTRTILYRVTRTIRHTGQAPRTTIIGKVTNPSIFRYLDQIGQQTAEKISMRMVEVTIFTLNPYVFLDDEAVLANTMQDKVNALKKLRRESYWRQTRVVSRNLRR